MGYYKSISRDGLISYSVSWWLHAYLSWNTERHRMKNCDKGELRDLFVTNFIGLDWLWKFFVIQWRFRLEDGGQWIYRRVYSVSGKMNKLTHRFHNVRLCELNWMETSRFLWVVTLKNILNRRKLQLVSILALSLATPVVLFSGFVIQSHQGLGSEC